MPHTTRPPRQRTRFAALAILALVFGFFLGAVVSGIDSTPAADASSSSVSSVASVLGVIEERPVTVPSSTVTPTTVSPSSTVTPTTVIPTTVVPITVVPAPAPTTSTPTPAPTTTTTTTVAPVPKSAGEQAEELLNYPWREKFPTWTLVWADAKSGVRALTFPDRKVIEMYVRPGDDAAYLARVLAHEFGHVADIELNTDADRARWREVRGISDTVYWWPQGDSYDFDTGAGDFAEAFATLLVGSETKSRIAGQPTSAQLDVMAELVR